MTPPGGVAWSDALAAACREGLPLLAPEDAVTVTIPAAGGTD